ncbi:hypothetical protein OQA88_8479 [Cercophora sp. LCS_1]
MASTDTPAAPWHAAFPAPKAQPGGMSKEAVLELIRSAVAGRDYVLVDLRRIDHEGGTIRGSINLPAQSLYPSIPTLYTMFKAAGVPKVLWYCGSSGGRGTRAAAWFADYIQDQQDAKMESLILQGGIKGWARGGPQFVEQMLGYDASYWA